MGKAYERFKQARTNTSFQISGAADYEEYPELSTFLAGVLGPDGKSWECQPQTVTLWLEADMVHFCIGRREEPVKIFGSFGGLSEGLAGLEAALASGRCSERKKAAR